MRRPGKSTTNVIAILVMLLISIIGGLITQRALSSLRKAEFPREYADIVSVSAYENLIPEWAVYASVKVRSDFDASKRSDDGKTGLFQLTEDQYFLLSDPASALDPGLLYDPAVNIKLGCRWISYLYGRFGSWEAVWAAMYAGEDAVDGWMQPSKDGSGRVLAEIPDVDTAEYTALMKKTADKYKKIYIESLTSAGSDIMSDAHDTENSENTENTSKG